ncbi:Ankyrin repeat, PH and SEC7 domain containing protein secG-like [Oopsacas minuta]|uniref:Ankyrin repeat, PH and SEC7 domain containing protein secG-like n=1 Tax=Oopsacas minuta TaxID=111878 RepID=A0AAV7JWW9_9METZ|nr:Ankyrin repeat, PH and SEC7 domain containing protein secG-like [Oopsacas minuta]
MINSDIPSKPLTNTSDSAISDIVQLESVELNSKLCYIVEDNKITPLPGLVITNDDITTTCAKSWIKVQYIRTGETKECIRDLVKVLESKDILANKINTKEVIDELIQLDNSHPLNLAIQQKALDLHIQIPVLEDKLIHYTAKNGTVQCLTYLLNACPNFPYDDVNEDGNTLLHSAVQGGINELIYLILDMAGNPDGISDNQSKLDKFLNMTNLAGNTALHLCMIHKKREPIRPLLRAGVKLKVVNAKGNTLLHLAAERDEIDYIKRIINYHLSDTTDQVRALGMLEIFIS